MDLPVVVRRWCISGLMCRWVQVVHRRLSDGGPMVVRWWVQVVVRWVQVVVRWSLTPSRVQQISMRKTISRRLFATKEKKLLGFFFHDRGMAKTRSMTRKENHDASMRKRFKTCDNGGQAHWSDLNHDLLSLVMMQLGIVDFLAFSGVCKSWRSFALSNRKNFMASRSPMCIYVSTDFNQEEYHFYLEDNEGKRFKTILPHSTGSICLGLTSDYVILFGLKSNDFWLVNPITRHELHFPDVPSLEKDNPKGIKGILVFSPSISRWVFAMTNDFTNIWFSIAGERRWNYVSSDVPIIDLHAFKGKMYTINNHHHLCELILNNEEEPKLTLIETNNFPVFSEHSQLIISRERICVLEWPSEEFCKIHMLDLNKMKWWSREKTRAEYDIIWRKIKDSGGKHEIGKLFIGSI
ncbi:hypothetical protein LXL04_003194 [Taraxacum kok-saghyz]